MHVFTLWEEGGVIKKKQKNKQTKQAGTGRTRNSETLTFLMWIYVFNPQGFPPA